MPKARVLVAEDEILIAENLRIKLEALGFEVSDIALTGEEAVEFASQGQPDIILMDINLAGNTDGIEAAGIIQGKQNIPIIFVTAFSDSTTLERVKKISPYGYIVKPFQLANLQTSIELALHRHKEDMRKEQNQAHIFSALKQVGDAMALMDASKNILFVNIRAEELLGIAGETMYGRNFEAVFTKAHRTLSQAIEERETNPMQTLMPTEREVMREGQESMVLIGSFTPLQDEKGMPTGWIYHFSEKGSVAPAQNEAVLLNEVLELEQRNRSALAYDLHEGIGQVLSAAKMNLETLRQDPSDTQSLENSKRLLDNAVSRVRSLSQDVHPGVLRDFGLAAAIDNWLRKVNQETGLNATCTSSLAARLPASVEYNLYKALQSFIGYLVDFGSPTSLDIEMLLTAQKRITSFGDKQIRINISHTSAVNSFADLPFSNFTPESLIPSHVETNLKEAIALVKALMGSISFTLKGKKGFQTRFEVPIHAVAASPSPAKTRSK